MKSKITSHMICVAPMAAIRFTTQTLRFVFARSDIEVFMFSVLDLDPEKEGERHVTAVGQCGNSKASTWFHLEFSVQRTGGYFGWKVGSLKPLTVTLSVEQGVWMILKFSEVKGFSFESHFGNMIETQRKEFLAKAGPE